MGIALLPWARLARSLDPPLDYLAGTVRRRDTAVFIAGVFESLEQTLTFVQSTQTPGASLYANRYRR